MNLKPTRLKKMEINKTIVQPKNHKKMRLQQHTSKIEQKLARLKLQVDEKRNTVQKNRFAVTTKQISQKNIIHDKKRISSGIKAFTKTNNNNNKIEKTEPSNSQEINSQIQIQDKLRDFLKELGYSNYEQIFIDNGIDSFMILQEIKQKQLQQIGVQKGHALKITVKLKKMKDIQNQTKVKNQTKSREKSQPKCIQNKLDNKKQQPLQIIIQTQSPNLTDQIIPLRKRRYFCLYCSKVSDVNFCNQDCQFMYNKMFERYQKNLAKAQQAFSKKQNKQSQDNCQGDQFIDDVDILQILDNQEKDFNLDQSAYQQALEIINQAKNQKINSSQDNI